MCLGVPLKIVEIQGKKGIGEVRGVIKEFRLDYLREPKVGEFVMVHAGFAIEKIDNDTFNEIVTELEALNQKIMELENRYET